MYSSSFSCAVIVLSQKPPTHLAPGAQLVPTLAAVQAFLHCAGKTLLFSSASSTWKSLNRTRPHCSLGGVELRSSTKLTGVLYVKWSGIFWPVKSRPPPVQVLLPQPLSMHALLLPVHCEFCVQTVVGLFRHTLGPAHAVDVQSALLAAQTLATQLASDAQVLPLREQVLRLVPSRYNHCWVFPGTVEMASESCRTTFTEMFPEPGVEALTASSQPWNAAPLGLLTRSMWPTAVSGLSS